MTSTYHNFIRLVSTFKRSLHLSGLTLFVAIVLSGCAYRLSGPERSLPQGYHQMTVPIFKNYSQEVGSEVPFTNALIQEFERSKVGRVVTPNLAEVVLEGEIRSIEYKGGGKFELVNKDNSVATGPVLAAAYEVAVVVGVTVRRLSDKSILWAGEFRRSSSYTAPQVTLTGINTVNPLYNLSARRQTLELLANDMMAEAHDRITENF